MAIRLVDGFDHYATADGAGKWTTFAGTIQGSTVRNGVGALSLQQDVVHRFTNPAGAQANGIQGFGFRIPTAGTTRNFSDFLDSGTVQVSLHVENDNTLTVKRNGSTIIGQSAVTVSSNTWYWVEWKVVINNTTGSAEVRLNGAVVINVTNVDTQHTVNATYSQIGLDGITPGTLFDDYYFADGSSTFLGDSKVVTVIASSGDGDLADFTPSTGTDNGAMVDDTTPDGDATFNASATVNHRDSYNFAALGVTGTVHCLQLNNWVKKSDSGARTINGFSRISSVNFDGANFNPSDASYSDARDIWETSPATAVAWTVSEIDGAQFGIRVQA